MPKNCIDGENVRKVYCTKKGCHGKTAVIIGDKNHYNKDGWSEIKNVECSRCGKKFRCKINEDTGKVKVV